MLRAAAPVVRRAPRALRIEIPSRYDSYVPVLLGVWLLAWAAAVVFLLLGWAGLLPRGAPGPVPASPGGLLFFAAFAAAGGVVAWRLAWVLRGREIVELKDDVLTLTRALGRREGRPKRFAWHRVRDLRADSFRPRVFYPSWGRRFVGKGDACIAFRHGGKRQVFGRGLRTDEARELVDLLRAHDAAPE